jgi:hypothetical protein
MRIGGEAVSKKCWIVLAFAVLGAFFTPELLLSEVQCPWLNAATAAGVLGGDVQASALPLTLQGDTTCDFKRIEHSAVFSLTITVHTMSLPSKDFSTYLTQCTGTAVRLKGIGNEAIQCVSSSKLSNGEEQIIGRVRERAFIIDLKRGSTKQSTANQVGLSDEARNIAEQVAGALF